MKVIILKSENGKITSEKLVEGEIGKVVREVAMKALEEWNESTSDFIIMKDSQEAKLKLPLKPNVYEEVKNFLAGKEKGEAILRIPVYIISYDNVWKEEDFQDKRVYVISYYVDDKIKDDLIKYAIDVTSENKKEEEPMEDIEEEE